MLYIPLCLEVYIYIQVMFTLAEQQHHQNTSNSRNAQKQGIRYQSCGMVIQKNIALPVIYYCVTNYLET